MSDGRAKPPPLPDFLHDESVTATINRALGTNYTLEQIEDAPELWITKIMLWANGN